MYIQTYNEYNFLTSRDNIKQSIIYLFTHTHMQDLIEQIFNVDCLFGFTTERKLDTR